LSTEYNIQQYASAETNEVTPNMNIVRFIKPCVRPAVNSASGSPQAVGRVWMDMNQNGASWYGYRSLWTMNALGAMYVDFVATYVICCRNQI